MHWKERNDTFTSGAGAVPWDALCVRPREVLRCLTNSPVFFLENTIAVRIAFPHGKIARALRMAKAANATDRPENETSLLSRFPIGGPTAPDIRWKICSLCRSFEADGRNKWESPDVKYLKKLSWVGIE